MTTWGELLKKMVNWQREQFPQSTSSSTLKHLKKEIVELESDPKNLDEWVDIFFFAVQGMDRAAQETGMPDYGPFMFQKVQRKLAENMHLREWPGPDAEGVYEHKRD